MYLNLKDIITDFNLGQVYVLKKLSELGYPKVDSLDKWHEISRDIRRKKRTSFGGCYFRPHGNGVEFQDGNLFIDFDFGDNGESNGFDYFRLWNYIKSNKLLCIFKTKNEIDEEIIKLEKMDELRFSGYINYYPNWRQE